MKYNKVSESDRRRIIEAYNEDKNWRDLCKSFKVNISTAYEWIRKGQTQPKKKGGSQSKKTAEIINCILDKIEKEPSVTLSELTTLTRSIFDVSVCVNTMKNWLDGELISLKDVRPMVHNVNTQENKVKRAQYLESLMNNRADQRTLIWIDETNFNLYCRRREGRSKIGSRSCVVQPNSKGSNLHCIGAMTDSRMLLFTTRRGSLKATDFNEWVEQLIETCFTQGIENPTLIIDNAPAHTRAETVVENYENVNLLRLAPYSYLLNPIELVWSAFKSNIKQKMRQRMEEILNTQRLGGIGIAEQRMRILEEIAVESIGTISGRMFASFAARVERYYPSVMRLDDLKE